MTTEDLAGIKQNKAENPEYHLRKVWLIGRVISCSGKREIPIASGGASTSAIFYLA
jgi:hypothetical protein